MSLISQVWCSIKPSYHARRGFVLALLLAVLSSACVAALHLDSGFGRLADFLFVAAVALLGIPLSAFAIALLLKFVRKAPVLLTGFFIASSLFLALCLAGPDMFRDMLWTAWLAAAAFLFIECALGATLATILRGGLRDASLAKCIITCSVLFGSLLANVALAVLLAQDDKAPAIPANVTAPQNLTLKPGIANPSDRGNFPVKVLYYGTGDSLRRPEYGLGVAIRTRTVNASAFFHHFGGWKAWLRKKYWGFGMDKLPLNARVAYPVGNGPFPLFVMVHGNHNMSVASDRGYDYLCDLLASRGFIAVSVDEDFLNFGLLHDLPKEQPVRAWLLLEHLRLWHFWSHDPNNPFFGRVDLSRIALGGHSRGGEAAATAALFNKLPCYPDDANIQFHYGYQIKAVLAISAVDGQYKPAQQPRVLTDISYLALQGANDSDVSDFEASSQYDRVQFSGGVPAFKAELYVNGVNHARFNTRWGRRDTDQPQGLFLNARSLIDADAQQRIGLTYTSAFLEAALHGRHEYLDLFRDYRRGRDWLPDTSYVNRFQDNTYQPICAFNEDSDLTTTTMAGGRASGHALSIWREGKISGRSANRDYNGLFLGWNWSGAKKPQAQLPSYEVQLSEPVSGAALSLSVAVTDDDAPELGKPADSNDDVEEKEGDTAFTVEAEDINGVTARVSSSMFALLPPPFHVQFTKLEILDRQLFKASSQPVFQTIRIPLGAFVKSNSRFKVNQVRGLRLIFDQTPSRVVIIGGIGIDGA